MPAADIQSASDHFLAQLESGKRLAGCYLLEKRIEGTAQPLWLALDEVLGKKIALHFLPHGTLSQPGLGDRLRQEVKRSRQFINQRVIRVLELVEEDEWGAIAMEQFAGRPLSAVVDVNTHGFFEVAEVQPLVRELCELFTAAHEISFVHGSLSLENILVGDGQAKLMEFGIGAALRQGGSETSFLSAQQLAGATATSADDIFAIGAVLHTVLAGAPPFEGRDRKSPPSIADHRRQLNHRGGEIPEDWERTIASCLAEDPAARPASADEIVKQLGASTGPGVPTSAAVSLAAAEPSATTPAATTVAAAAPTAETEPPTEAAVPASGAAPAAPTLPVQAEKPADAVPGPEEPKPANPATPAEPTADVKGTKPELQEAQAPSALASSPVAADAHVGAGKAISAGEKKTSLEEKKPGKESVSTQKPAPPPERMDPAEIAARVRREEAEEEARHRRYADDEEEAFYDRPHGAGPSLVSIFIIVAALALIGFLVYKYFLAERPASQEVASETVTDVNLPTPVPEAATPEPIRAAPTPIARTNPAASATPMALASDSTRAPGPTPVTQPPAGTPKVASSGAPVGVTVTPADDPKKIEAAIAELKAAREKVTRELPTVKKTANDLDAQQRKLTEDVAKAEKAAEEAEKIAIERKKAADDVRKSAMTAAQEVEARKLDVVRAEEALARLELDLKDKERVLIEAKAKAEAAKQGTSGKSMAGSTPTPRSPGTAVPSPPATPAPVSPTITPDDPRAAFEQKMKELSRVLDGAPGPKPATPAPATPTVTTSQPTATPMQVAKATTPSPAKATARDSGEGILNSLGMRLVPLPGTDVLMCIWPTRVRDFEAFANATRLKSNLWKDPGFKQTVDHPVVNVTWQEADAFCKWLTAKERKEGVISEAQIYRLPTDLEWSQGAGLGPESGNTPEARDMSVPEVYPWGKAWPPPRGAGNYTGEETNSDVAIKGYNDGFAWTSPVGSFPPNKLGLYDMGGNVWQWCMDSWSPESKAKVLRGASWYNGALKLSLLTSCRIHASPDSSTDNYGFRVVLTSAANKSQR